MSEVKYETSAVTPGAVTYQYSVDKSLNLLSQLLHKNADFGSCLCLHIHKFASLTRNNLKVYVAVRLYAK